MTSKRDDRVTPSHSYKFVAALQDKQVCANPTFLYAAEQFGHWANTYQEQKMTTVCLQVLHSMK